jgi:hypothetical protein
MPANTLLVPSVVKVKENVLEAINNYSADDSPFTSMIGSQDVSNVYFEWQRDVYRAPVLTNAAIEGADAAFAAQTQPGLLNNRTQIFQDTLNISNTAEAVKKYGRDKEYKRLLVKKAVELKRDYEANCISSGATVTDNGSVAGKLRGLAGFLTKGSVAPATSALPDPTTNTAPNTGGADRALTETMIKDAQQSAYENGGDGAVLLCSPAHKIKISTFTFGVSRTHEVTTKAADIQPIAFDFIRGDFGMIKVVPNRVMAISDQSLTNSLYLIDPDKCKKAYLRSLETEKMGTVGDSQQWQIRMEASLWIGDERCMYQIRDITTSGS